jgi:hypothetical protein
MKIAIDVSQMLYGTGVASYTKNLVENLLAADKENEYVLFGGSLRRVGELKDLVKEFKGNYTSKIYPYPPSLADLIWNKLHVFPVERMIGDVDILHTSDWVEPPSKAFKVTTVHDLAPIFFPNLFPRDIVRDIVATHRSKLELVKKESSRVLVPSNSSKDDLIKLGFKAEIIRVTPEAVPEGFKKVSEEEISRLKKKYNISGDYVLSVGMNPRKNTKRIIEAFDKTRFGKDLKLVFIGLPKYMKVEEKRNIRIAGHVEESDLPAFYSGAKALIYPSLYEGFGLPVLEAFACECPVVTSNVSSLPEVAGNAAELVDPYEVDSISEGIIKVLRGPKSYIQKGLERVKDFSWEKTAKMTLDVYREAKS